jgi:asparagine synthase (glutamine-hydrolysing)
VVRIDATDVSRDFQRLLASQDFPIRSSSVYAQYRVFARAREAGITVMLDGQGADELFGGYRHSLSARLGSLLRQRRWGASLRYARRAMQLPADNATTASLSGAARFAAGGAAYLLSRRAQNVMQRAIGRSPSPAWLNADWLQHHGVHPQSVHFTAGGTDVLRASLLELIERTSLPSLLRFEDRNSMAWSVESRVPFLTPQLCELVQSLPEEYLVTDQAVTKAVFREAMRGIVPDPILDRRDKIGFATPEHSWMTALAPWVRGLIDDADIDRVPVLNGAVVRAIVARMRGDATAVDPAVWRCCSFLSWVREHDVQFD